MYQSKLVVAIKSNGKILRENKDIVQLPYGSEFSVLVKNLDNRRVKFKLEIDGTNVLDGTEIIVNANSETEIKRFIRNGNMDEGNAFKFIERTSAIEDGPRGIKIEDGIVRVEFTFEQPAPVYTPNYWTTTQTPYDRWGGGLLRGIGGSSLGGGVQGSISGASYSCNSVSSASLDISNKVANAQNEAGITVPGSKVEQKFTTVYGFNAESTSNVLILRLVGRTETAEVKEAVTVQHKPKCITCGRVNKANSKFCTQCGTSLTLI